MTLTVVRGLLAAAVNSPASIDSASSKSWKSMACFLRELHLHVGEQFADTTRAKLPSCAGKAARAAATVKRLSLCFLVSQNVELPDSFSPELKSLLEGLLQRDVSKRLGCQGRR